MATIYAPNEQFNGIRANVVFTNGVGETADPALIEWFRSKGYRVVSEENSVVEETTVTQDPEPKEGKKKK